MKDTPIPIGEFMAGQAGMSANSNATMSAASAPAKPASSPSPAQPMSIGEFMGGKSVDSSNSFDATSVASQRAARIAAGEPVSVYPDRAEPTLAGKLVRGLLGGAVKVSTSVIPAEVRGTSDYLGNVGNIQADMADKAAALGQDVKSGKITLGRALLANEGNALLNTADVAFTADGIGGIGEMAGKTAAETATETALNAAKKDAFKALSPAEKTAAVLRDTGKTIAKAAPVGYGLDMAGNAADTNNKTAGSVLKPGVGTLLSTALPVAGGAYKLGASTVADAIAGGSARDIDSFITKNYEKGVKPSVASDKGQQAFRDVIGPDGNPTGERVPTGKTVYQDKTINAVKTIAENRPNLSLVDADGNVTAGQLPKNLREFQQSIDQTKAAIYKAYTEKAQATGSTGATLELEPVASELDHVANDKVTNAVNPATAKYAADRAALLRKVGSFTPEEAQSAIQQYNTSLEAFYRNPSYDTASRAGVDAMVANKMRAGLDDLIENSSGEGYQDLKNRYGALKAIEKDVVKRATVDARKAPKGLLDFTDIASGAELVKGLATMNPASLAGSAAIKGISRYYKYLNDPNTAIKALFKGVARNMEQNPQESVFERHAAQMEEFAKSQAEAQQKQTYTQRLQELLRQKNAVPEQKNEYEPYADESKLPVIEAGPTPKPIVSNEPSVPADSLPEVYTPPVAQKTAPQAAKPSLYEPYTPEDQLPVIEAGKGAKTQAEKNAAKLPTAPKDSLPNVAVPDVKKPAVPETKADMQISKSAPAEASNAGWSNGPVPKELKPLADMAKKYKTAEGFKADLYRFDSMADGAKQVRAANLDNFERLSDSAEKVTAYRGSHPSSGKITPGDWITLDEKSARSYSPNVVKTEIPKSDIVNPKIADGEYIYAPKSLQTTPEEIFGKSRAKTHSESVRELLSTKKK